MNFETEILKPISEKVVLCEIDIGKSNDFWVSFAAGVYIVNFLNLYAKLVSFPNVPDVPDIIIVGSVTADGVQLSRVLSPTTCISQDSSFYYEAGTRTLYVHCPGGDDPDLFKMSIGQVYGFRKGGICALYGGVDFQNKLLEAPNVQLNKDPLFWGVISFDSMTFKIDNSDGKYNLLTRENNIFGNKGRVFIGFDYWPLIEFQQIFEGIIGKITTNQTVISVEVKDSRIQLKKAIPENTFTTEDYPNINQNNIGKPIPRIFGNVRNVPIYVIDEDKTTGGAGTTITYTCKISDSGYTSAISGINAIYVNDVNRTTSIGSVNLGTRTFTLKHSTSVSKNKYNPGDEVTGDLAGEMTSTGGLINNGGKIIRKLLYDYYGYPYSNDFYNISKWDEIKVGNICLWLGENQEPLIDIIGLICSDGIQGDFFVSGDGRYCLRIYDENRSSIQTISRNQILETPEISDDPEQVITSCLIGYNKDWAKDEYRLYVDISQEEEIWNKYPVYNQKRFDTLTESPADAFDYSQKILSKSDEVRTIITIKVPGWICVQREISDFITIYCNRPYKEWYKRVKCEIIGIEKDFNNHISNITCLMIQRLDDIPYTESFYYTDNYAGNNTIYYGDNYSIEKKYYSMTINEV